MMQRGDLVTVSLLGDSGKPRPALVVQSDLLAALDSVVLCPITSELREAAFRVNNEPSPSNGLQKLSQVMVEKLSALPRARVNEPFGRVDDERMRAISQALLLVDPAGRARAHAVSDLRHPHVRGALRRGVFRRSGHAVDGHLRAGDRGGNVDVQRHVGRAALAAPPGRGA